MERTFEYPEDHHISPIVSEPYPVPPYWQRPEYLESQCVYCANCYRDYCFDCRMYAHQVYKGELRKVRLFECTHKKMSDYIKDGKLDLQAFLKDA